MRILIFVRNFLPYSETFIHNQISMMPDNVEVFVLCLKRKNKERFPFKNVYCLKKITIVTLLIHIAGLIKSIDKERLLCSWYAKKIEKIVNKLRIDLLHIHFGSNLFQYHNAFLKLTIPILVTFHGYDATVKMKDDRYRSKLVEAFNKVNVYGIAVSKAIKDSLCRAGLDGKKINLHYIGIDCSLFIRKERFLLNEQEIKLIQVGRFVQKKGHEYTVSVLEKLFSSGIKAHVYFIGNGPLMPNIVGMVQKKNLTGSVSFLGVLNSDEVKEKLSEADIFVQPSITADNGDQEGLPISIMEAMAIGLPVVSTYHSGIPEIVRNGVDGYLFEEKDVDGYYQAIRSTIDNYCMFNESRMDYVLNTIDIRKNGKSLSDLYHKIIQAHRG